jgi:hypothetical protein
MFARAAALMTAVSATVPKVFARCVTAASVSPSLTPIWPPTAQLCQPFQPSPPPRPSRCAKHIRTSTNRALAAVVMPAVISTAEQELRLFDRRDLVQQSARAKGAVADRRLRGTRERQGDARGEDKREGKLSKHDRIAFVT